MKRQIKLNWFIFWADLLEENKILVQQKLICVFTSD